MGINHDKKSKTPHIKAFTLVELLVVISILAILATVSIISYSYSIKKANRSNDVTLAGQYTTKLVSSLTNESVDIDDLSGIDIRTYLINSGFNPIPSSNEYTYVFNRNKNSIEVVDIDSIDTNSSTLNDMLEISNNIILLGEGNSEIEKAISSLCFGDYSKVEELSDTYESYKNHISENYSKSSTVFVTPVSLIKDSSLSLVKNVVLVEGLSFLPNVNELRSLNYDTSVTLVNKLITSVMDSTEDLQEKFDVECSKSIQLTKLDDSVKIYRNSKDISNESIVNYEYKNEGIVYSLYDSNNESNKVVLTFLNKKDVKDKILYKEELSELSIESTNSNASSLVSYSRVATYASGTSLYKMSIMFYDNYNLIGYKEIYYVV